MNNPPPPLLLDEPYPSSFSDSDDTGDLGSAYSPCSPYLAPPFNLPSSSSSSSYSKLPSFSIPKALSITKAEQASPLSLRNSPRASPLRKLDELCVREHDGDLAEATTAPKLPFSKTTTPFLDLGEIFTETFPKHHLDSRICRSTSVSPTLSPSPVFNKTRRASSDSVHAAEKTPLSSQNPRRPSLLPRKPSWVIVERLALKKFRKWIVAFCVVTFDLEMGQALEVVYPPIQNQENEAGSTTTDVVFGERERKDVCFSAFPDSNAFESVGDTVFSFRFRASRATAAALGPEKRQGADEDLEGERDDGMDEEDPAYLYGYVFFRQKKDERIRRGYFQKSVVLLSFKPLVGLFSRLVSLLGPAYFATGKPMLEAACHNIASWPAPIAGSFYELPFLGNVLQVELPKLHQPQLWETSPFRHMLVQPFPLGQDSPLSTRNPTAPPLPQPHEVASLDPKTQILAGIPPGCALYENFGEMLDDLWLCWELVLLAEPIVLMAPNPKSCSECVLALVDLVNPIPYCGDFRPYFTIQDSDFKTYGAKNRPRESLILGVTNPYFSKALEHWPHVIRVGKAKSRKPDSKVFSTNHTTPHARQNTNTATTRGVAGHHPFLKLSVSPGGLGMTSSTSFSSTSSLDFVQGVTSKRKRVVAIDRNFLKKIGEARLRGDVSPVSLNNVLRRHFVDLTEKFLSPLDRYFATLMPVTITLSTSQIPQLQPFRQDSFLDLFKSLGPPSDLVPHKPFSSAFRDPTETCLEFYRQFLRCGNFASWLARRTHEAEREIRRRYLNVLCDEDVSTWMRARGRKLSEMASLLERIRNELRLASDEMGPDLSGPPRSADGPPPRKASPWHRISAIQKSKLERQAMLIVLVMSRSLETVENKI